MVWGHWQRGDCQQRLPLEHHWIEEILAQVFWPVLRIDPCARNNVAKFRKLDEKASLTQLIYASSKTSQRFCHFHVTSQVTKNKISRPFASLFPVVRPPVLALGGLALGGREGRRDLNSNKTKQKKNISLNGQDNTTKATLSALLSDCSRDLLIQNQDEFRQPHLQNSFCRSYANHLLFRDLSLNFSYILHPSYITFSFILPRN